MLSMLIAVILTIGVLALLDKYFRNYEFETIPGPKGLLFIENSLDFVMHPVKLFYHFRSLANKYKYLFKLKFGLKRIVVVYNPKDVELIVSGTRNNRKGFLYWFLKPWLKEGLLLSHGNKWLHRRKILTPSFHFNTLRCFSKVIEENSEKFVELLQAEVDKPKTDLASFITDFTLNSICETSMGIKLDEESSIASRRYKEGIYTFGKSIVFRAQRIWMYPNWLFAWTATGRKQQKILDLMSSFRDNVINKRRDSSDFQDMNLNVEQYEDKQDIGKKRLAMLDLLLQAEKEGTIDAKGIGEEVDTFMFEGHDTTATALQFTLLLLANHAKAQENVVKECKELFGTSDRAPTMTDLRQMKYLDACIKESLRLYPPVHFIMRTFEEPMKLKNYTVPAGTECAILTYDLHRRDDQFLLPLEFIPERFLTEPTWHPYSYIPFSAGPRNCIGQKFAMMELKIALSGILRRYRLLPVTKIEDVIFTTDFILRANHPIYVKLENRT